MDRRESKFLQEIKLKSKILFSYVYATVNNMVNLENDMRVGHIETCNLIVTYLMGQPFEIRLHKSCGV